MPFLKHIKLSNPIFKRLAGWGFTETVLPRIGALAVVWGIFETNLETALWALRGDQVSGNRPWTDKTPISEWIKEFGKSWSQLSSKANDVLREASFAAHDLMEYRHAIMHGSMIPGKNMPSFIRNPRWHGEDRKRPSHDAHVDENLLDLAIDSQP